MMRDFLTTLGICDSERGLTKRKKPHMKLALYFDVHNGTMAMSHQN